MLTQQQNTLLRFIHQNLKETGIPPSFQEMATALDLHSKSGVHRMIIALEERGFIRRLPQRARAIELLRLPDSLIPPTANVVKSAIVPVIGRIAAGTPISALQIRSHSIGVPAGFISDGEHYALEVFGDSMIEAGILDGDTVIIKKQSTAQSGDIVVAFIDNIEATLKRLRIRGSSIALEAANPVYETRIFGPGRVAIQGKLVSLVRKY